ncbi:MAG: hydrogenase nickel incorporation protein HypA [Ignisphaera sp.]|uniref:Hydrogenase nickel incorporation protein HypA n=1 Tax=Ignisphaera aggregans TaxID=334771 RepID=A0A7C4H554_9CREN
MHEWALAEGIIEALARRAKEAGVNKFGMLKIILGELQQVDREILKYALDELLKLAKDSLGIIVDNIVFEEESVVLQCSRCGYRWRPVLDILDESVKESIHFIPEVIHVYISCPQCGSHDFSIIGGRGIAIEIS